MLSFDWLKKHRFVSLTRREHDWVFEFDTDCNLVVSSLWRLIDNGRICITSVDEGQQFGLPAPLDVVDFTKARISGHTIDEVELRESILDLRIHFDGGCILEVLPDSSGYEAWSLQRLGQQWIAQGGGNLVEFKV